MKTTLKIACSSILMMIALAFINFTKAPKTNNDLEGAWSLKSSDNEQVLLLIDGYFVRSAYNKANKKFIETRGGTYEVKNDRVTVGIEFDTKQKEIIGKSFDVPFEIDSDELSININGNKETWTRIDNTKENLAGTWKISGRMQDGQIVQIHQTGPRKTVKVLSGTRFQWAAINPETREFFGTGGGNYTFKNGKYTENIEFFSRDSSRVGTSLTFDGKLENGEWHHSGLSSRGDKIYEVWKRIK